MRLISSLFYTTHQNAQCVWGEILSTMNTMNNILIPRTEMSHLTHTHKHKHEYINTNTRYATHDHQLPSPVISHHLAHTTKTKPQTKTRASQARN